MNKEEGNLMRLNKAIASRSTFSRRKADELIKSGKVKVNNRVVTNLNCRVLPSDNIFVDDKVLTRKKFLYFLFYKPPSYITTRIDELNRKTIFDLLPESFRYLKPVGRLDRDSEGLLLLTNDGDFINKVLHPKNKVEKTYLVKIKGSLSKDEINFILKNFLTGLRLDGKLCKADRVKQVEPETDSSGKHIAFETVIHEGINRQIRRMFQVLGYSVKSLIRTRIGNFNLHGLQKGKYKEINTKDAYAIFSEKR